jgi:outer membrane receptor for ferrienterochelin and colicin
MMEDEGNMVRAMLKIIEVGLFALTFYVSPTWAGIDGSVSGAVTDPQGIAVSGAKIIVLSPQGAVVREAVSSITGEFQIFPLTFGAYNIIIDNPKYAPFRTSVYVSSGGSSEIAIHLLPKGPDKEIVLEVKAKRRLIQKTASTSSTEIGHEQIQALPQGSDITLPKLLSSTTPGAVQGPFGQTFIRGNHANIQYQIDGVQLPDSPSNTFGQAFSPRNIDHMEVITGGIPAEYGERLAAVINIVTKTGPEKPGGVAELNYGSYNTLSPTMTYFGSNESGALHYFVSANYFQSDRGLDTPQPKGSNNSDIGGEEAIHDKVTGNSEFAKFDWLADNSNKYSLVVFNSSNNLQIPNFPSSFKSTDSIFNNNDKYGNSPLTYTPAGTNDYQSEVNAYIQAIWRHTFSDHSFMQVAPYYKYSYIHFQNDPTNDLVSPGSYSFYESRNVNNYGLKTDYTLRVNDQHLLKTGFQVQSSVAQGVVSVQQKGNSPVSDSGADKGVFESVYLQDDYSITKSLVLNAGLRFDATQFNFGGDNPSESLLQPRIGLSYMLTDTTKVHVFYGKLFQPSAVENLRDTTQKVSGITTLSKYDIKAEKDDYYETGIAQQFLETHVAMLNVYYKNATNMLDDMQLFNTSIAQPYNYQTGYAYGVELSMKGEINSHWSQYVNYAYEIAKGKGIGGGLFVFQGTGNTPPSTSYKFLDHVQVQTANAGLTYKLEQFSWTTQALFGSGLRTDPNNGTNLPPHLTFDTTLGYQFNGDSWATRFKVAVDILNILDNSFPISIANGFNGSHYAAGREFFIRLGKEL